MNTRALCLGTFVALACNACTTTGFDPGQIHDVYRQDLHADEQNHCGPKDLELSNADARHFFKRAKIIDLQTLNAHYDVVNCYTEGSLRYKGQICEWQIQPTAVGTIRCGEQEQIFACDGCEDIFDGKNLDSPPVDD